MDSVRGTAIVLLLMWHASAIPEMLGLQMPESIRAANAFFLPYRMPTLMLLSGILLAKSLRKPLPAYYAGKFAMILWPYLVWVLIAKATFLDVEGMPWWHWRAWYATSYLWFLFFIGVYYLVAPAFRRLPVWVPIAAAAVLGQLLPYGSTEQRLAYFAIFFFAGSWLGNRPAALEWLSRGRVALTLALPVVAFGVVAIIWTDAVQYAVWGAPLSIAGALSLSALYSRLEAARKPLRRLRFVGRSSLVYYVSHFPLMAMFSQWTLHALPPLLLAVINLILALVIGSALAALKERAPICWLFRAPRPVTRALERVLNLASSPTRR
ncbi:acyltransferase family protein [Microbacterium sp. MC2]